MDFSALFDFKKMVTPTIIKVVYYLGLLAVVISGLGAMAGGPFRSASIGSIFTGLCIIVLGSLFWRISCELMIVLFTINENIQAIRDRGDAKL